jgi:hypothetical protein
LRRRTPHERVDCPRYEPQFDISRSHNLTSHLCICCESG